MDDTADGISLIVDGHVHIGEGVDGGGFRHGSMSGEQLLDLMDGPFALFGEQRRIDRALVQPNIFMTRFGDPAEHHAYVSRFIAGNSDRLVGCFVVNPLLDLARNLEVLEEHLSSRGFRAIKLHPMAHGYLPTVVRDELDPVIEMAHRFNRPVLVHQGDPPFSHPSLIAPIAKDFPDVSFILAHFATQRVVMASEAIYVAATCPNVYLETGWGALPRLKEGIAEVGAGRLIFGSDCPIQEMGSQMRPIEALGWDEPIGINLPRAEIDGILGNTLWSLLGMQ
jgi:predicted TIM-barrel fold metal-dependent hydrolase